MLIPSLQAVFQGAEGGAVAGHSASLMVRFWMPNEILKVLSYSSDAEFTMSMMFDRTASLLGNLEV
jgi:hypothetical protein